MYIAKVLCTANLQKFVGLRRVGGARMRVQTAQNYSLPSSQESKEVEEVYFHHQLQQDRWTAIDPETEYHGCPHVN